MKKSFSFSAVICVISSVALAIPDKTPQWGYDSSLTPPNGQPLQYKIGTSWSPIPLLSTKNVWTASQEFDGGIKIGSINNYSQLVTDKTGSVSGSKILDVTSFGIVGDITTDNASAYANLAAEVTSQLSLPYQDGVEVRFPCGRFMSTSSLEFSLPNNRHVTISGGGNACTTLYFKNSNGIKINYSNQYSSSIVKGMTIATNDTTGSYTGLWFKRNETANAFSQQSLISNVTFQAYDSFSSLAYWGIGFFQDKVSYVNIDSFQYAGRYRPGDGDSSPKGTAIQLQGDAGTAFNVITNINKSNIDVCDSGIKYSTYYQGLSVNSTNIVNCNYGIYVPSGVALVDQLSVTNSQMNNYIASIGIDGKMLALNVSNTLFISRTGAYGIKTNGLINSSISSNSFQVQDTLHTGIGIQIGTSSDISESVVISSNVFNSLDKGIVINSGAKANIIGNNYNLVATPYSNSSTTSFQHLNTSDGTQNPSDSVQIQSSATNALSVGSSLPSIVALQVNGSTSSVGIGIAPSYRLDVASSSDGDLANFSRIGGSNLPSIKLGMNESSNKTSITSSGASGNSMDVYVLSENIANFSSSKLDLYKPIYVNPSDGTGYAQLKNQSIAPSTPSSSGRIYFDSSNRLSWIGSNGYSNSFDATANTSNIVYTLPNSNGTFAVSASSPLNLNSSTGNLSITGLSGGVLAGLSPSFTISPTLGVQQTTQGSIILANTALGNYPTTIQSSNSASAAWTLTLPTTAGTNKYPLLTDGNGVSYWGQLDISAAVSGVLPVANGGTGQNSLSQHGVVIGNSTSGVNVTAAGSSGQVLQSGGASSDPVWSTATFPSTATSTGSIIRADGTNWSSTSALYPNSTTINQILYSSSNNQIAGLSTANGGVLNTSSSGVPSITSSPILGVQQTAQGSLIFANTAAGSFSTTVQSSNSASAAWTLTLPTTSGTNGYPLITDGSGVSSWSALSNSGMANMAANTIKGNNTGSSAAPSDLTVSNVNSMLSPAWTSYTPTIGCSSGSGTPPTPSSSTGKYSTIGKTTFVQIKIVFSTPVGGTCTTNYFTASIPATSKNDTVISGASLTNGQAIKGFAPAGGSTIATSGYAAGALIADGYQLVFEGSYENQ